ncbi:hypothetical protein K505DRAFT_364957 [Melanomma pulvis-pyrius CBS 109.77]|uniref:NAD(P)-binding protein n=1 Tax=Melanomma pulvis-pyrius CBS 109.77 TaxID=1314802 RepID=A0A6A6X1E5_9PLEO|nr:hypothetical protein K505DRAFT_364957 [Melanomma pulvis-pyrius CBS 109.77]
MHLKSKCPIINSGITRLPSEFLETVAEGLNGEYGSIYDLDVDGRVQSYGPIELDQDSLAAVRQSPEETLSDKTIPQIDIIVTNAGGNVVFGGRMIDGIEKHFVIKHLTHFLFVTQLFPNCSLPQKRTTSTTPLPLPDEERAKLAPFIDILEIGELEVGGYEPAVPYGHSKTVNVLLTVYVNTILVSHGIYVFAVHPGIVNSTGAERTYSAFSDEKKAAMAAFGILKTTDQGCATIDVAALDPGLTPNMGYHKEKAERLWKSNEELIGGMVSV